MIAGIDIGVALDLIIKIGIIIVPILFAFYRKDKDALARLLASLPNIYGVVQQEARKGDSQARTDPLGRAMEVAASIAGGKLSATQAATVRSGLQAIHERSRAK